MLFTPLVALIALVPYVLGNLAAEVIADKREPTLLDVAVVDKRAPADACAVLAGKKWVSPKDLRACYKSIKVDSTRKNNILDVTEKTLPFHTSTNYQILAPPPFTRDVHEDLVADLKRIRKTNYKSDYDFHIDISRSFKRLNDGHCVWINACFDSAYLNYLPIPLVLLTNAKGAQKVHISPKAFAVARVEFADQIAVWQSALPTGLTLAVLDGAEVVAINDRDPWAAVNANAAIAGSYQAFGTRQNGFFSSYQRAASSWNFIMGNFAQQALPLDDEVKLTLKLTNSTRTVKVTLPYRARVNTAVPFTDTASYLANNCVADEDNNGIDYYATTVPEESTVTKFRQAPLTPKSIKEHLVNAMLDDTPLQNVVLPPELAPTGPITPGVGVGQFYMQPDGKTGVLALGSFSGVAYEALMAGLLEGLLELKSRGATQLIVDVTNNGGGFICVAHFLHRIIIGPKPSTVNAGLPATEAHAPPLAQAIVKSIINNRTDPAQQLLYNPLQWRPAGDVNFFDATDDWLDPPVKKIVNFRKDNFSQKLGEECQPEGFTTPPPVEGLFAGDKVVIVSNGRCASSCSLFSITMSKHEKTKTVVVGGNKAVPQQYCGIVGGQSTDFTTIDSEIKTSKLKEHFLAPPDMIVNGVMGITWRLGYGIDNPNEPEEWQNHPATYNLPLTAELATNPPAIWTEVAARYLK